MVTGLIRKARWARWQLRYWVLDKYHAQLRVVAMWACVAIAFAAGFRVALDAAAPPAVVDGVQVQKAWVQIVWQIAVMVISALIAYSMRPKIEKPQPQEGGTPTTEDGRPIKRIYGTVWADDSIVLGWKNLGVEEIKSKGGKKWKPGLLPGTTNPIESWLDNKWNVSGLADVDDPLGGGTSGGD